MISETFSINGQTFRAVYTPAPVDRSPAKWDNQWVIYCLTYHKSTRLRQLRRPRSQQIPRLRRVGVFETLEECKRAAEGAAK